MGKSGSDLNKLSKAISFLVTDADEKCSICNNICTLIEEKALFYKRFFHAEEYFSNSNIPQLTEELKELGNQIFEVQMSYVQQMNKFPKEIPVTPNYEVCRNAISWRTRLFHNRYILAETREQGRDMCAFVSSVAMTESLNKREHAVYLEYVGLSHRDTHFETKLSEHHLQDMVISSIAEDQRRPAERLDVCFEKLQNTGVVSQKAYDSDLKDGCFRHCISKFEKLKPDELEKAFTILDSARVMVGTFGITPGYFSLEADEIYDVSPEDILITNAAGKQQTHAVVLVGYGISSGGIPFYVFQNSYGDKWGNKGFGMVTCRSIRKLYTAEL